MEVSTIASMIALSREGHLRAVLQILSFLKSKNNFVAVFDPTEPDIYQTKLLTEDWSATTYGTCREYSTPTRLHLEVLVSL